MGGARIHEIVEAVWNVDLIEAQLRSCLALPPTIKPSRRPRSAVVNTIVHAPATGRLAALPFADRAADCVGPRDRCRSGGRRPRGRPRPGLRDRAGGGDPRRQEPPARESADRGSAAQSTAGRAWVATGVERGVFQLPHASLSVSLRPSATRFESPALCADARSRSPRPASPRAQTAATGRHAGLTSRARRAGRRHAPRARTRR